MLAIRLCSLPDFRDGYPGGLKVVIRLGGNMGGLKVVIHRGGNIDGLKVIIRLGGNIGGLKVFLSGWESRDLYLSFLPFS